MKKILLYALSALIVVGAGGYFLVRQSYAATPADPLYSVQEAFDNIQRALTLDEVSKTELEQRILERREAQIERMLEREDITDQQMEEALELMFQQRIRVQERLQTVEQTLIDSDANERAVEAIQNVQQLYDESLDRQIDNIEKAQERHNGIGQEVKERTIQEAQNRGRMSPPDIVNETIDEQENIPVDIEIPAGRGR